MYIVKNKFAYRNGHLGKKMKKIEIKKQIKLKYNKINITSPPPRTP